MEPLVSVVMPVYNSELYVRESIESILNQSYSNFEFIIIDDGSTDRTSSIIENITDNRICYIRNQTNTGNYFSRNTGCRLSKGKYICVMDADDIASNERIEKQVLFLENNPSVLLVGSDFKVIGFNICRKIKEYPFLKIHLLHNNMFLHPSLMIRKDVMEEVNFYNEEYLYASDYDLVCRISLLGKITNLDDILIEYRIHQNQISNVQKSNQAFYADIIRLSYLNSLGFRLTAVEKRMFTELFSDNPLILFTKNQMSVFVKKLNSQNKELRVFDIYDFDFFLRKRLLLYFVKIQKSRI